LKARSGFRVARLGEHVFVACKILAFSLTWRILVEVRGIWLSRELCWDLTVSALLLMWQAYFVESVLAHLQQRYCPQEDPDFHAVLDIAKLNSDMALAIRLVEPLALLYFPV
jgi:hypothetical protein